MQTPKFISEELAWLANKYDGPIPNTARWDAHRPQSTYSYTIAQIEEAKEYLGAHEAMEALLILSQWESLWRDRLCLPVNGERRRRAAT